MAIPEHSMLLDQDVQAWNRWRSDNPAMHPDLSGISLSRKRLAGVDFARCNLTGTHLNHTDLSACNLERANLSNASLQQANLANAQCRNLTAYGANFAGANAENASITEADLSNTHLAEINLESADISGTDISRSNLFMANLRSAELSYSKLLWSNLTRVDLSNARLDSCDLTGASFIDANLAGANLSLSNLRFARFIDSNLDGANFSGCRVYGVSVWNVTSEAAMQSDLVITPPDEVTITVDNLEIAQFIYLLLDSKEIRRTIDTISSKLVLILGRFTPQRFAVLDALKQALRDRGYLPVLFNVAAPSQRDLTETISTLAHLARFVLADITDSRSIPQELMAIVPQLPSVPVQPLLLAATEEYSLFEHLRRYPWVLETFQYRDIPGLLSNLDERVIEPAEMMALKQTGRGRVKQL